MSAFRPAFLSHAHLDNALADRYAAALGARGVDVWYDRSNAQTGHFLGEQIQRELERRPAFVLLLTQHALDSYWVSLETQAYLGLIARERTRLLLPVRIGACAVPALLNAFLWIDALALPFDEAIDAIVATLDTHVSIPPPPPLPLATPTLPAQPGPAAAPRDAQPAQHLTPMSIYTLGFRGWTVKGVEVVLPPLCPVPNTGDDFTMGSDKARDPQASDDETPQYPTPVGAYQIGQYPVTVAEYARAVDAKAVDEPQEGSLGIDWKTQLTRLDHPVVCVTWKDASAYAAWLARTTGQPWRLPTEAEWEKAARWDPARKLSRLYPWEGAFDKARCNTSESGLKTTTPVGAYADRGDASPYGAHDQAGNVWEWTSSLDQPYPYRRDDGREKAESPGNRVLRGGSWSDGAGGARAAFRFIRPGTFIGSLGFRLALAPAGSF